MRGSYEENRLRFVWELKNTPEELCEQTTNLSVDLFQKMRD